MNVVLHYTDRRGAGMMQTMHSAEQTRRRMDALRRQHVPARLEADGEVIGRVWFQSPDGFWNYMFDPSVFAQGIGLEVRR